MKTGIEEVSEKIKEAIKMKLIELGAYVDDELADYIMVMVANKKSQQSMTDDLSLFLGSNTEKFTSWLISLLKKLQIVSEESQKPKSSNKNLGECSNVKLSASLQESTKLTNKTLQSTTELADSKDLTNKKEHLQYLQTGPEEIHMSKTAPVEPEINICGEKDDFIDEQESRISSGHSSVNALLPSVQLESVSSVKNNGPKVGSRSTIRAPSQPVKKTKNESNHAAESNSESKQQNSTTEKSSRKRPLGSAIGAILIKDESDDDDGYTHHSVPSSVHITPRKSSVPIEKQATASLLLRAISEAEVSLDKYGKKVRASSKDVAKKIRKDESTSKQISLGDEFTKEKIVISVANKNKSGGESESLILPEHIAARGIAKQLHKNITDEFSEFVDGEETVYDEQDQKQLAVQSVFKSSQSNKSGKKKQFVTTNNTENDATDDESLELSPGLTTTSLANVIFDSIHCQQEMISNESAMEKKVKDENTKFVITLNGVDEKKISVSNRDNRNIVRVKPQQTMKQDDSVSITMEEEEEQMIEEDVDKDSGEKQVEKCKFWPNCKNGDDCPFLHPTVPCKFFPRCHFGNKCIYIHPQCKFDAACTRADCPFTHSSKRASAASVPIIIQPLQVPVYPAPRSFAPSYSHPTNKLLCKFYPNCTNPSCSFEHPKPCRYGIGCTHKETCMFEHPSLPTKDQLNWTAKTSAPSVS